MLPGQREIHFKKERPPRRRLLADRIAELPATVLVYTAPCAQAKSEEAARQRCLERAIQTSLGLRAHRLAIDSREEQDRHDRATIQKILGDHPSRTEFVYEHIDSSCEPLIWIADVVAWCYRSGGDWRRRIMPIVTKVIDA